MAEGKEINNVIDFTAYRMQRHAEAFYAQGDVESAEALWDALEGYLEGVCDVKFIGGKTYLTPVDLDFGEAT